MDINVHDTVEAGQKKEKHMNKETEKIKLKVHTYILSVLFHFVF